MVADDMAPFPPEATCPRCEGPVRAAGWTYVLAGLLTAPVLWLVLHVVLPSMAAIPAVVVACGASAVGVVKILLERRRSRQLARRGT